MKILVGILFPLSILGMIFGNDFWKMITTLAIKYFSSRYNREHLFRKEWCRTANAVKKLRRWTKMRIQMIIEGMHWVENLPGKA